MKFLLILSLLMTGLTWAQDKKRGPTEEEMPPAVLAYIKSTPCGGPKCKGCPIRKTIPLSIPQPTSPGEKDYLARSKNGDFIFMRPDGYATLFHCSVAVRKNLQNKDTKRWGMENVLQEPSGFEGKIVIKNDGFEDQNDDCVFDNLAYVKYTISFHKDSTKERILPRITEFFPINKKAYTEFDPNLDESKLASYQKEARETFKAERDAFKEICPGTITGSSGERREKNRANGIKQI